MTGHSFLPGEPALRSDPVGDDAGEDEDHPHHDHEMGEVLPEREGTKGLVVDGVEERVRREVEDEAERDDGGARLRKPRNREAGGDWLQELGTGASKVHALSFRFYNEYRLVIALSTSAVNSCTSDGFV
jgi:hypothetical protein